MFPTKVVARNKIHLLWFIQFLSKFIIFREKWDNVLTNIFFQNSISSKRKMFPTKVVGRTQIQAKFANQVGFTRSVMTGNHKPNPKLTNDYAISQIYKNMNKLKL